LKQEQLEQKEKDLKSQKKEQDEIIDQIRSLNQLVHSRESQVKKREEEGRQSEERFLREKNKVLEQF